MLCNRNCLLCAVIVSLVAGCNSQDPAARQDEVSSRVQLLIYRLQAADERSTNAELRLMALEERLNRDTMAHDEEIRLLKTELAAIQKGSGSLQAMGDANLRWPAEDQPAGPTGPENDQLKFLTQEKRDLIKKIAGILDTDGVFGLNAYQFKFAHDGPGEMFLRDALRKASLQRSPDSRWQCQQAINEISSLLNLNDEDRRRLVLETARDRAYSKDTAEIFQVLALAREITAGQQLDGPALEFAQKNKYLRTALRSQ